MTSESKILTVSYGTFSCTLEGFDNPFDTMKAIAEYFRDLAAQDRHFGAEPPPPDAAMLHRLAEREVSRLAASKAEDMARFRPADGAETPAPRIQINPVQRRSEQPVVEAGPQVEEPAVGTPAPSLTDVIPDGVAAKLARIRRAAQPAATVAEAPFPADPERSAPVGDDDGTAFDKGVAAGDGADFEGITADYAVSAPGEDDTDAMDTAEWPLAETALADTEAPHPVEGASEVAARLGALISSAPAVAQDAAGMDDRTQDGARAAFDTALSEEDAPLPVEIETELDAAVAPAALSPDDATTVSLEDEADLSLGNRLDDAAFESLADHPVETDFTSEDVELLAQLDGTVFDEDSLAASLDDTLPEDQPVALNLTEAAIQDPLPEAVDVAASDDALPEESADVSAETDEPVAQAARVAEEASPSGKPGARTRRVNSRVVRIHPSEEAPGRDLGATRVLDDAEEASELSRLMQQADEVMAEEENRRRHEALSRLKAAVAATEADRADIDYEAPKADANLDPYRDDLAEAIQPDTDPEPAPAPDVKPTRRKSVMIRPANEPRPGTIRPGMISPPPLVLVSEQRVDRVGPATAPAPASAPAPAAEPTRATPAPSTPEGQPMVALRTGRLSGAIGAGAALAASSLPARNLVLEKPSYGTAAETEEDEDLAEDSKEINEAGLASFAEMVGARSMAEMLEAAAAYATCVENRTHFTRPQLMRRMMASAGGKPVSREDGLRSFGTLLRTGRIEKVTRGHYSLAENSPYLAEARRLS